MECDNLTCSTNIEWLNKNGTVQRKVTYKKAQLKLLRNDLREIFIEVMAEKAAPIRLLVKNIKVHNKFMNQGKASIVFVTINCTLYLSNAPTSQLMVFLRTIFVKMTGQKVEQKSVPLRNQLLGSKPSSFEEISPVTVNEMDKAQRKVSRATDTTPSPLAKKRKISGEKDKPMIAKKLYSSSPIPTEVLDLEQREVLEACLSGKNVFFTGSAGTGKSYLLKRIIGALPPDSTFATASTGVAACHIGGITLHQFAGIGKGDLSIERSIELASKQPSATIWRKCKILIIDEISMVDGIFFEKLERVARAVRNSEKPFGGIQLILCGDFFQLPPVSRDSTTKFCFQSKAWDNCRLTTFELKVVHRQNDQRFINILNKIRLGNVDQIVTEALVATNKQQIERDGILATRLCTHTKDADVINETKLGALEGKAVVFEAIDSVPGTSKQLDMQTNVPGRLELKIGAQVMLLKNINVQAGLVNGARGVVKGFKEGFPLIQMRNKKEHLAKHERWVIKSAGGGVLARKQVPLKLAWAFSIHKSQGLTLDCVEMSLGRVFEAGQAYVALSRAQSLEALRVLDFKAEQVWANPEVLAFYKDLDRMRIVPLGEANRVVKKRKVGLKSKLFEKPLVSIS